MKLLNQHQPSNYLQKLKKTTTILKPPTRCLFWRGKPGHMPGRFEHLSWWLRRWCFHCWSFAHHQKAKRCLPPSRTLFCRGLAWWFVPKGNLNPLFTIKTRITHNHQLSTIITIHHCLPSKTSITIPLPLLIIFDHKPSYPPLQWWKKYPNYLHFCKTNDHSPPWST